MLWHEHRNASCLYVKPLSHLIYYCVSHLFSKLVVSNNNNNRIEVTAVLLIVVATNDSSTCALAAHVPSKLCRFLQSVNASVVLLLLALKRSVAFTGWALDCVGVLSNTAFLEFCLIVLNDHCFVGHVCSLEVSSRLLSAIAQWFATKVLITRCDTPKCSAHPNFHPLDTAELHRGIWWICITEILLNV